MRIAIVGCGLIGRKRLKSLVGKDVLVVAADVLLERAQKLISDVPGATATTDWERAVTRADVDAVMVATTNQWLAPVSLAAIQAGKHVLVEKPAARSSAEIEPLLAAAKESGVCVQVGFNHRYHSAFQKAYEIFSSGAMGPLMFVRGRYGHGGRIGYDREWRAYPEQSGGGELLDQGVHLIDLASWFLGPFTKVDGFSRTFFWDMAVEDNGFLLLRTPKDEVAFLHASCTEWKNMFSFEVYGRNAKLQIEGLGGSYGLERLCYYKMLPAMGPPETTIWEYPGEDLSWERELESFRLHIQRKQTPQPGLQEASDVLKVVETVYQKSAHDHNS